MQRDMRRVLESKYYHISLFSLICFNDPSWDFLFDIDSNTRDITIYDSSTTFYDDFMMTLSDEYPEVEKTKEKKKIRSNHKFNFND